MRAVGAYPKFGHHRPNFGPQLSKRKGALPKGRGGSTKRAAPGHRSDTKAEVRKVPVAGRTGRDEARKDKGEDRTGWPKHGPEVRTGASQPTGGGIRTSAGRSRAADTDGRGADGWTRNSDSTVRTSDGAGGHQGFRVGGLKLCRGEGVLGGRGGEWVSRRASQKLASSSG